MKLATRLTLLFTVLTAVVGFSVGLFAVNSSSQSQYAALDAAINSVVASGKGNPNSALSNALNVVQRNNYDLTLDVIAPSGTVTQVTRGTVAPKRNPSLVDARASRDGVRAVADLPGFRIGSLNVGGGDVLVVAGSTSRITEQSRQLALDVALAGLVAVVVMLLLARLVMRRDLEMMERLIAYATDVAEDNETTPIPPSVGSSDLRELRSALAVMVASLHQRIAIETKSVESMQQFIGDASHELRTPLTVVKGYNELLARPGMSEERRERAVERMRREIVRMEALVSDLLLSAEVRETSHRGERQVDLSLLLATRVDEFINDNPSRLVTTDIAPNVAFRAREDFLDRLLTNAFSNIARHTLDSAGVRVSLARSGDAVLLRIEDAGLGLSQYGVRPQRFQRGDSSRSRETGGSGLGMSIMADIVDALGGTMVTSKSPMGGLALNFRFPVPSGLKDQVAAAS